MLVGKHMSTPVITIHPDTTLPEALNLMQKEKVRRFPVVKDDGKLVGIVSGKRFAACFSILRNQPEHLGNELFA